MEQKPVESQEHNDIDELSSESASEWDYESQSHNIYEHYDTSNIDVSNVDKEMDEFVRTEQMMSPIKVDTDLSIMEEDLSRLRMIEGEGLMPATRVLTFAATPEPVFAHKPELSISQIKRFSTDVFNSSSDGKISLLNSVGKLSDPLDDSHPLSEEKNSQDLLPELMRSGLQVERVNSAPLKTQNPLITF